MFNFTSIAGARPNFMKIAPVIHQIKKRRQLASQPNFASSTPGSIRIRKGPGIFLSNSPYPNLMQIWGKTAERIVDNLIKNYPAH